jgi:hypothetical protein
MQKNKKKPLNFINKLGFSNVSYWGKLVRVLFYGFLGGLLGLYSYLMREGISSPLDLFINFFAYFGMFGYLAVIVSEKSIPKIRKVLSKRWKQLLGTIRYVYFGFCFWVAFFFLIVLVQILQPAFVQIALLIWTYIFIIFLGLAVFYPVSIYVPVCQFVTSEKVEETRRKDAVNSLAILTPMLGAPWVVAFYVLSPYVGLENNPLWIAVAAGVVYLLIYIFFIDLPYALTVKEKRQEKIYLLQQKKLEYLKELAQLKGLTVTELLMKVNLELEMVRIERDKAELESESVHPFKLTVPIIGLVFTTFSPLIIELIKTPLGI